MARSSGISISRTRSPVSGLAMPSGMPQSHEAWGINRYCEVVCALTDWTSEANTNAASVNKTVFAFFISMSQSERKVDSLRAYGPLELVAARVAASASTEASQLVSNGYSSCATSCRHLARSLRSLRSLRRRSEERRVG